MEIYPPVESFNVAPYDPDKVKAASCPNVFVTFLCSVLCSIWTITSGCPSALKLICVGNSCPETNCQPFGTVTDTLAVSPVFPITGVSWIVLLSLSTNLTWLVCSLAT